jgi:hypothetical protein
MLCEIGAGAVPQQGTTVRAVWDDREWRILFEATDRDPWATLTGRGAPLYTEEVVEVFFDPVADLAGYFEIEVNPLNAVLEVVIRRNPRGLTKDFRWRCEGLRTAVMRTATGWAAELSIPFADVMNEPPRSGMRWRANFTRIDRPRGQERELTAWSPTYSPTFHVPDCFGIVEFAAE